MRAWCIVAAVLAIGRQAAGQIIEPRDLAPQESHLPAQITPQHRLERRASTAAQRAKKKALRRARTIVGRTASADGMDQDIFDQSMQELSSLPLDHTLHDWRFLPPRKKFKLEQLTKGAVQRSQTDEASSSVFTDPVQRTYYLERYFDLLKEIKDSAGKKMLSDGRVRSVQQAAIHQRFKQTVQAAHQAAIEPEEWLELLRGPGGLVVWQKEFAEYVGDKDARYVRDGVADAMDIYHPDYLTVYERQAADFHKAGRSISKGLGKDSKIRVYMPDFAENSHISAMAHLIQGDRAPKNGEKR